MPINTINKLLCKYKLARFRAHNDDPGNETADRETKDAVSNGNHKKSKKSKSYIKRTGRAITMRRWAEVRKKINKERKTFKFFSTASLNRLYSDFYINQLLTGHGYLTECFWSKNLRRPNTCEFGLKESNADNEHILSKKYQTSSDLV